MKWNRLTLKSAFIDPLWYRRNTGVSIPVRVEEDLTVVLDGETLVGCPYPPGTEVKIRVSNWIECVSTKEIQDEIVRRKQVLLEEQREIRRKEQLRNEQDQAFNDSLAIPVKWVAARLDVLSGLLENSTGDGYRKSTVQHILLKEDLHVGRIHREANTYLCLADTRAKGNYSNTNGEATYGIRRISCKQCLKLALKLKSTAPKKPKLLGLW
ncbi:MAG: hypothetical protein ABJH04_07670 [Cyclobacteriaceae bacterium]